MGWADLGLIQKELGQESGLENGVAGTETGQDGVLPG